MMRIDLDFRHGLPVPVVEQAPDGAMEVRLSRGAEMLAVHLSITSLETLSFAISAALLRLKRC
jgi:hypothetical protein